MKQYIFWKLKPVEGGYEHPNTGDQDKQYSDGKISFIETPFGEDKLLATITYDGRRITQKDIQDFINKEPLFYMQIATEEEVIVFLNTLYNGEVVVDNFTFTDNRRP